MQTLQNTASTGCRVGLDDVLSPSFFKALGDPNRVAILAWLSTRCAPATVSEVASCCDVHLSVVSRHLAILRDAGILAANKQGREIHYTVRYPELVRTLRQLADSIEACCPVDPTHNEVPT